MSSVTADDRTFDELLAGRRTVLVDFAATWCGPCKVLAPLWDQAAQRHPDAVLATVDVDGSPQTAARFGVRSVPTIVAFRDGEPVATKVGLLTAAGIDALVAQAS